MTRPHTYEVVDHTFLDRAPVRVHAVIAIDCTPDELFRAFEREDAWRATLGLGVKWTSPKPYGVGTTRTITTPNGQDLDEVFVTWEDGKQMAFYIEGGSTGMFDAFFEDYAVKPLGEGRCMLTWRVGIRMRGISRLIGPLVGFVLKRGAQNFAKFADFTG